MFKRMALETIIKENKKSRNKDNLGWHHRGWSWKEVRLCLQMSRTVGSRPDILERFCLPSTFIRQVDEA